jgi:phosphate transport system ATP-binding protein
MVNLDASADNPSSFNPQAIQQHSDSVGGTDFASESIKVQTRRLNLHYGPKQALFDVSVAIPEHSVTALIGPSGCGKSTFLRSINRMNDLIDGVRIDGEVLIDSDPVYAPDTDLVLLRKRVGMVFQKSNPFPQSIYNNIAYGPQIHGVKDKKTLDQLVERSLTQAGLWEEVKDRLKDSAMSLSGGQQQRLCVARALAVEPEILLMDEPTSALDPHATQHIEELIQALHHQLTIIIVTHNMQQAARISQFTGFFLNGHLTEFGRTSQVFGHPQHPQTQAYVSGQFG